MATLLGDADGAAERRKCSDVSRARRTAQPSVANAENGKEV